MSASGPLEISGLRTLPSLETFDVKLVPSKNLCDGIPYCDVSFDDELPLLCPNRFHCNASGLVNIAMNKVCD